MAPPKVLPDVLHAFIGALIVDSEYNYSVVEGSFIIHPHLLGGHVALQDDSVGHGTKSFERYKTILMSSVFGLIRVSGEYFGDAARVGLDG
jgi:hypothetical protein